MELVAAAPTLDAPDLIATSVGGRLSPAQRRVLGRDLYRAQGLADFR